jgi:hypothetical protein
MIACMLIACARAQASLATLESAARTLQHVTNGTCVCVCTVTWCYLTVARHSGVDATRRARLVLAQRVQRAQRARQRRVPADDAARASTYAALLQV